MKTFCFFAVISSLAASVALSQELLSETFPDRGERDLPAVLGVESGQGKWNINPLMRKALKIAPGGGLTVAPGATNASLSVDLEPSVISKGGAVAASVEFTPGTGWAGGDTGSGVTGVHIGFADSALTGSMVTARSSFNYVAARMVTGASGKTENLHLYGSNGQTCPAQSTKGRTGNPEGRYRISIEIEPEGCRAVARLASLESGSEQEQEILLDPFPEFSQFRIDLTSLRGGEEFSSPVIHSVKIEKR
jgi:hypothetical protein